MPVPRAVRYVRPDEMHQTFNFPYLNTPWDAAALQQVIDLSLTAYGWVGAPATWVLSNHDVVRHATRLGYPLDRPPGPGIGLDDPQPDVDLGVRRARAATMLMLALPGSAYLYQGEELGLPEHTELPNEFRQDPNWVRKNYTEKGRDGARIPLPWLSAAPALGFGTQATTWLPQPTTYSTYARDVQETEPDLHALDVPIGAATAPRTRSRHRQPALVGQRQRSRPVVLPWSGAGDLQPGPCETCRYPPGRSSCCPAARSSMAGWERTCACGGSTESTGREPARDTGHHLGDAHGGRARLAARDLGAGG